MDPVTVPPGSPATTQTRRIIIRKPRRRRMEDELDLRTPSGRELPY
jgi:hypothetical protein